MTRSISNNQLHRKARTGRISGRAQRHLATRRRGSVLVLVMTILSVLFVVGVAFLATMNFEADTIAAERVARRNREGIRNITADLTQPLREALVTSVFTGSLSGDPTTFAAGVDLPGWHNLAAPIEPLVLNPGEANPASVRANWTWFTDIFAVRQSPFGGPSIDLPFIPQINTALDNGDQQLLCDSGFDAGFPCASDADCFDGGICTFYFNVLDADGDGIVDSPAFDARALGLPEEYVERLSIAVNGRPDGAVFIGVRVVPHGGMVNLNDAHPYLIARLFGFDPYNDPDADNDGAESQWPPRGKPLDNEHPLYNFRHRPTQTGALYNPAIEEPILRRRGSLLTPRVLPVGTLLGTGADPGDLPGDMIAQLLAPRDDLPTGTFEQADPTEHRYWMYARDETVPYNNALNTWVARLSSIYVQAQINDDILREYDRRHVVTTISHDDNFHRGGQVMRDGVPTGLVDALLAENREHDLANPACDPRFLMPTYPPGIDDDVSNCFCPSDTFPETAPEPACKFGPRKGRLKLSLPWLDDFAPLSESGDPGNAPFFDPLTPNNPAFTIEAFDRNRLIYEYFWALVNNAAGPYWETRSCTTVGGRDECGGEPYICDNIGEDFMPLPGPLFNCVDETMPDDLTTPLVYDPARRRDALITRVAASLAVNLIDFADSDNLPTRMPIREFRLDDNDAGTTNFGTGALKFVYGLERQPFITEVASAHPANGAGPSARAIELYNPYGVDIVASTDDEWLLYEVDPNGIVVQQVPLTGTTGIIEGDSGLASGEFTVYKDAGTDMLFAPPIDPAVASADLTLPLMFAPDWTLLLVRRYTFPGDVNPTNIVVDQFKIPSDSPVGGAVALSPAPAAFPYSVNLERRIVDDPAEAWLPVYPVGFDWASLGDPASYRNTLGSWNVGTDVVADFANIRAVEANFANDATNTLASAFPTTGSLLLLMRHANRDINELNASVVANDERLHLSFNSWLADVTPIDSTGDGNLDAQIREALQVDNGRMPVFDAVKIDATAAVPDSLGFRTAHHVPPRDNEVVPPPGGPGPQPGDITNLPWGQLVFDYFTTLPLESRGSYRTRHPMDFAVWEDNAYNLGNADGELGYQVRELAIPRVDQNGARIHGRIDLNTAPREVLASIPFVPLERIPTAFRATFDDVFFGANPVEETKALPLGRNLADGIIAYREARIPGLSPTPYGDVTSPSTRAWSAIEPGMRRGTGFLTVGELLNVRFNDANAGTPEDAYDAFRFDGGEIPADATIGGDFITAAARLIALSDWVTVRSHVYTVYGVVRGEADPDLVATPEKQRRDLDGRTIRFQQTIDRMPMLLGASEPENVTPEVIERYNDVVNN